MTHGYNRTHTKLRKERAFMGLKTLRDGGSSSLYWPLALPTQTSVNVLSIDLSVTLYSALYYSKEAS